MAVTSWIVEPSSFVRPTKSESESSSEGVAVTRAAEVRRELDLILGGQKTAPLQPLVDELADLVELAFTD